MVDPFPRVCRYVVNTRLRILKRCNGLTGLHYLALRVADFHLVFQGRDLTAQFQLDGISCFSRVRRVIVGGDIQSDRLERSDTEIDVVVTLFHRRSSDRGRLQARVRVERAKHRRGECAPSRLKIALGVFDPRVHVPCIELLANANGVTTILIGESPVGRGHVFGMLRQHLLGSSGPFLQRERVDSLIRRNAFRRQHGHEHLVTGRFGVTHVVRRESGGIPRLVTHLEVHLATDGVVTPGVTDRCRHRAISVLDQVGGLHVVRVT